MVVKAARAILVKAARAIHLAMVGLPVSETVVVKEEAVRVEEMLQLLAEMRMGLELQEGVGLCTH